MNSVLSKLDNSCKAYKIKPNYSKIKSVKREQGKPNILITTDKEIDSYCLDCSNKTCLRQERLIKSSKIPSLTTEKEVCPTEAIKRNEDGQWSIDKKLCVGCGLCSMNCRYRAIYQDFDGMFTINHIKKDDYTGDKYESVSIDSNVPNEHISEFGYLNENINVLMDEFKANKLVSNYLNSIFGFCANTNRNRNLRFDGYFQNDMQDGFLSVDINDDSLSCIRKVLDAFACARQNEKNNTDCALIVLKTFPTSAKHCLEVLDCIYKYKPTSDLKIYITTVSCLAVLYNNKCESEKLYLDDIAIDYVRPEMSKLEENLLKYLTKEQLEQNPYYSCKRLK